MNISRRKLQERSRRCFKKLISLEDVITYVNVAGISHISHKMLPPRPTFSRYFTSILPVPVILKMMATHFTGKYQLLGERTIVCDAFEMFYVLCRIQCARRMCCVDLWDHHDSVFMRKKRKYPDLFPSFYFVFYECH